MSEKKRTRLFAKRKCFFCGSDNYCAKGLCKTCYNRLLKTGTLEYKDRSGPRPQRWGENTKRIIALYKSGMSQSEIAREIGVTRQAVHIVIKRIKQTNYDRLISKSPEDLAWFYARRIAKCYGCEASTMEDCAACWMDWLRAPAEE